jgi:hypothetical protein
MKLVKDLLFGCLGYFTAAEIGTLTEGVAAELTETALVVAPLVG